MDYSGAFAIKARAFGQKLGVLRPMVRAYRRLLSKSYEDRFHNALLNAIRPGDVVWDIGANVGFYTKLFADRVGPSGAVLAFEPSPEQFASLTAAIAGRANVQTQNVALSNASGTANFYLNGSGIGVTDGLAPSAGNARVVEVCVERADRFGAPNPPCVIKIDVEGFEFEVLQGLSGLLPNQALRAIFMEVHFLQLANRGLPDAPRDMMAILRAAGFNVRWVDPSHIAAIR